MGPIKFDKVNKTWNTMDNPLVFNPNISLANLLLKSMEWNGSRIAQISDDTGEKHTFDEIRMMTIRAAQNLQKLGFKKGDVISIMAPDVPCLAPIAFGAICLGLPIMNMAQSTEHIFKKTEPKIIFCMYKNYDEINEALNKLKLKRKPKMYTIGGIKGDSEAAEKLLNETGNEKDFSPVEVDGINDTAVIICTSGTTGNSKGACISHAGLMCEIEANMVMYANGIAFNPNALCCISGTITCLLGTIGGATRIIGVEDFSIDMEFRIIRDYKVTIVENDAYDIIMTLRSGLLQKSDLTSVKHWVIGGAKVPLDMLKEFNALLPNGCIHNEYGLVELGGIAMDFPGFSGTDTVGRMLDGFLIKIVDDKGNRCGVNVDGEICVKRRCKFIGYWGDKELSASVYDEEGFFKTGDIGHIDEDGYVYISDRKKDVVDYRLGWVFPSEVEEVIMRLPGVDSVCVIGVPYDEASEIPAAIVVRAQDSKITEDDVCKIVEANMIDHCKLRGGVYFTDSIPRTDSGKPIRNEVKREFAKLYIEKIKNEKKSII